MDSSVLGLIATVLLVLANAFFVAAEFALVKVRASQIELLVQTGNKTAKMAQHLIAHLDAYLSATQLGITLASLGLGWIGEPIVGHLIIESMALFGFAPDPELAHRIALPVAFILITFLHIVFGELAPKSLAIQHPKTHCSGGRLSFMAVFRSLFSRYCLLELGVEPSPAAVRDRAGQ